MSFRGPAPLPEQLAGVRYLFTDIDDTLTTEGRLLPQTYQALWDLHAANIAVVPVTGGSAGGASISSASGQWRQSSGRAAPSP